jgi:DNA-binding FadR family transcriptional regulator
VTALNEPVARTLARLRADQDSIVHLMTFRRANECLAARLAAELRTDADLAHIERAVADLKTAEDIPRFRKADASFHLAVAVAARNPYVEQAIVDAREAIFLLHGKRDYKVVLDTTLSAHQDILAAIEARDPARAEAAMALHIDVALEEIQDTLRDYPDTPDPAPAVETQNT